MKRLACFAWILVLVAGACDQAAPPASDEERPNVLIIVTDDQRALGTMRVMKATKRLVLDEGVTFTRAVATTPQCCPSRASILTGLYSHNHGVLKNTAGWSENLDEQRTIHRYLKRDGYRTAFFGKFVNRWDLSRDPRYMDEWAIFSSSTGEFYYRGGEWNVNGKTRTVGRYYTDFVTKHGNDFIRRSNERNAGQPWLLYLWPTAPHSPYDVDEPFKGAPVPPFNERGVFGASATEGKLASLLDRKPDQRKVRITRRKQLRTLMSVDAMVKEVFRTLRETGELATTIVIFMSDNGFLWGDYGVLGKNLPYVPSALVPLAMRWPHHLPRGEVVDSLVANIDIAPTVLEATGSESEDGDRMDGRSLLDAVDGEGRTEILLEHWGVPGKGIPPWSSILSREFQYIEYRNESGRVQEHEYYDLLEDPHEISNLVTEKAIPHSEVTRLSRRLSVMNSCAGAEECP